MRTSPYRLLSLIIAVLTVGMLAFIACTRDHENPLDPENSDPFDLRAEPLVGRIRLAWNVPDVPDLEGTVIYRKDTSVDTLTFAEIQRVASPESIYIDWDVVPETRYEYQVTAYTDGEESRISLVEATVPGSVPAPYSVLVNDHPNDQGTCLDISWALSPMDSSGSEVTGYVVSRDTLLDGAYSAIDTTDAGIHTYSDCSATPDLLYYYRIQALAAGVLSSPTAPASGRATDNLAPRPPTGVTASDYPADEGTAIEIYWNRSPDDGAGADDVETYRIFRSAEQDTASFYSVGSTVAGDTTYIDQDLAPGSIFYYRIKALDTRNLSAYSLSDSAIAIDNGAPGSPSSLDAENPVPDGGGTISLSWQKSPDDITTGDIEGYRIYRRLDSEDFDDPLVSVEPGTTEYDDTTVDDLVDYYYIITAYDGDLESAPSNEAGPVAADDELPPGRIIDLTAEPGDIEGQVNLAWTAPGDNDGTGRAQTYYIKYSATEIVSEQDWNSATLITQNVPTPATAGTEETMTAIGMPAWENIWFSIRAEDDRQNVSQISNSASTTPQDDVTPPGTINDLDADTTGVTEGQVLLAWTATGDDGDVGQATRYDIRASRNPINNEADFNGATQLPGTPIPAVTGTSEEFVATGLTPGAAYYFRLRVFDEVDNPSPLSSVAVSIAQTDVTPPGTVDDLTATGDDMTLIEGEILLSWTAVGDDADSGSAATDYVLRYRTGSEVTSENWETCTGYTVPFDPAEPGTVENLKLTGFDSETTYYFGLMVIDDNDLESVISNSAGTLPQTDVTRPDEATDLVADGGAEDIVEGQVLLTWTSVGDDSLTGTVSGYEFRYASTFPINNSTWGQATVLTQDMILRSPSLTPPGEPDTLVAQELEPGEVLYFACKAIDDLDNYSQVSNSPSDTVQVDVTPPAAITDLAAATGPTEGTITVRWTAVGDDSLSGGAAESYDLRWAYEPILTVDSFEEAIQIPDEPEPAEPGLVDSMPPIAGFPPGAMIHFGLRVVDESGNWSGISEPDSARSGADETPPPDVDDFDVEEDDEVLRLSWDPPSDPDYEGVLIGRKRGSPVMTNPVPRVDYNVGDFLPDGQSIVVYIDDGIAWDDTDVINDSTYHYRAYSYDQYWNYAEGVNASGTPADTTAPDPVTQFSARQVEGGIRLNWMNPDPDEEDLENIMIRFSTTDYPEDEEDGELLVVKAASPGDPDSVDHVHPAEDTYYYSAFSSDEVPNWSNPVNATAEYDITPPADVTDFELEPDTLKINISWVDPADDDLQGIIILSREEEAIVDLPEDGEDYEGETSIGTSTIVAILEPGVQEYVHDDLTGGTTYFYSIHTFDTKLNYSAGETGFEVPEEE